MRLSTTVAFATLLATVTAAPTINTAEGPDSGDAILKRGHEDKCGASSYENQTSGGSPLAKDCEQLIKNIDAGGTWTLRANQQRELAKKGTCAFGAQGTKQPKDITFGNGDIIDLVKSSIDRFKTADGKVGAKGKVRCRCVDVSGDGFTEVEWGIYHT